MHAVLPAGVIFIESFAIFHLSLKAPVQVSSWESQVLGVFFPKSTFLSCLAVEKKVENMSPTASWRCRNQNANKKSPKWIILKKPNPDYFKANLMIFWQWTSDFYMLWVVNSAAGTASTTSPPSFTAIYPRNVLENCTYFYWYILSLHLYDANPIGLSGKGHLKLYRRKAIPWLTVSVTWKVGKFPFSKLWSSYFYLCSVMWYLNLKPCPEYCSSCSSE